MIQRQMWTSLGLGALSILLIALPGSSSQTNESSKVVRSAPAQAQEILQSQDKVIPEMEVQVEPLDNEIYVMVNDLGDIDTLVREFDDPKVTDDDNLHMFIGAHEGWLDVMDSPV